MHLIDLCEARKIFIDNAEPVESPFIQLHIKYALLLNNQAIKSHASLFHCTKILLSFKFCLHYP